MEMSMREIRELKVSVIVDEAMISDKKNAAGYMEVINDQLTRKISEELMNFIEIKEVQDPRAFQTILTARIRVEVPTYEKISHNPNPFSKPISHGTTYPGPD
jgi:hypothetical protein